MSFSFIYIVFYGASTDNCELVDWYLDLIL